MCIENQNIEQNRFLNVLAYKSIDLEARSRRKNLVFHGLAECPSEDCFQILRDFLWEEMGIDIDDLVIERLHRLGFLHKARLKSNTPRRPNIVTFYEDRHTDIVMNTVENHKLLSFQKRSYLPDHGYYPSLKPNIKTETIK